MHDTDQKVEYEDMTIDWVILHQFDNVQYPRNQSIPL